MLDVEETIQRGAVQHFGDNVHAVLEHLLSSVDLTNLKTNADIIFFDLFGTERHHFKDYTIYRSLIYCNTRRLEVCPLFLGVSCEIPLRAYLGLATSAVLELYETAKRHSKRGEGFRRHVLEFRSGNFGSYTFWWILDCSGKTYELVCRGMVNVSGSAL